MASASTRGFSGFPTRADFIPLPSVFFSRLLPQIEDMLELKVTLHIFWLLYRKKNYPRFVTFKELLSDTVLLNSLKTTTRNPEDALRNALDLATKRDTLLSLPLEKDGETAYFLNTESNRKTMNKIERGEISLTGLIPQVKPSETGEEKSNIFTLYEQNIGLLTPMIAEELREAEKLYPPAWIEEAFREAVQLNKRNWRYISRILERWATEGKSNEKLKRDSEGKADVNKYIKGRYGHLVKR